MKELIRNKAFIIAFLAILGIALQFWAGSRFPALDQKALMAGTAAIEPLSFDTVLVSQADDPAWKKVTFGFVNWAKTNQRGMIFGFMLAAAILCLMSMFRTKSLEGSFSNSVLGVMIGTPLGVCVNCAAPIARGLHASGMRLETTLAAMISSPTLNIIVLTIVISLFPPYMVLLKVGGTLFFLLVVIPILARYFFKDEVLATSGERQMAAATSEDYKFTPLDAQPPSLREENEWFLAIQWYLLSYLRNIWFILRTTLPLMILAGVLGSIVVTLVPLETLSTLLPSTPRVLVLVTMFITAIIGVFLPVPIVFDVVVTAVLMAAGMPVKYAMILLFTLGIFSIYSYFIVQQAISRKVGLVIYAVIAVMGVGTGVIAHEYDKWLTERQQAFLIDAWSKVDSEIEVNVSLPPAGESSKTLLPRIAENRMLANDIAVISPPGIKVTAYDLVDPIGLEEGKFSRVAGAEMGVDQPYQFSVLRWQQPQSAFRGISSGDVHNDGWQDLLITSETGLWLYANNAGKFIGQEIAIPGLEDLYVVNAAFVDINNDGWLDIFYSTYREGNFVIYNKEGDFRFDQQIKLPNREDFWMSSAAAFADPDRDGDLDIVLSNWTLGAFLARPARGREKSRNVYLRNNNGEFFVEDLPGEPAETLSLLWTDFSGDGYQDLMVGNDFSIPDVFYTGSSNGDLQLLDVDSGIIPLSTLLTMSISAGDIDNDLKDEIYFGNVSGTNHIEMIPISDICERTKTVLDMQTCLSLRNDQVIVNQALRLGDPVKCTELSDSDLVDQCIGMQFHVNSWWQRNPELCAQLENRFFALSSVCKEYFLEPEVPVGDAFKIYPPQAGRRVNVLLAPDGSGKFIDKALEFNVRDAGWVWNAQFADLNQDEYQDLYIANGHYSENTTDARESNQFFLNARGEEFVNRTDESGLEMFEESSSYTYVDFDNDGDLDIVAPEALGPIWFFINGVDGPNSISFELKDNRGNHFGVGTRIEITYADGRQQVREIKASGGFLSFDAPIAHFGLGEYNKVDTVDIIWSTGDRSQLSGNFYTGKRYVINRL
ncbi:MAG: FG-GAP-like repeat-containing protein [Pseudomonadota bacterium]|nr:FG-GAP-like repeat-containing protein [Pseudomonadota bacterium]